MSEEPTSLVKILAKACGLTILGLPEVPIKLGPHTWVFGPGDEPLGIVFNTWPDHVDHLVCWDGVKKITGGVFVNVTYKGKEYDIRGIKVVHRRYYDALIKKFKGLSAGNL